MYKEVRTEPLGDSISCLQWAPSGDNIAIGTLDEKIIIKDAELNNRGTLKGNIGIVDLDFNIEGTKLAVSCMDYSIMIVDVADINQETLIECDPLNCWKVKFAGDSKHIYTGGENGRLFYYDIESGELKEDYRLGDHFLTALSVSGKGDLAVGNTNGDLNFTTYEGESTLFLTEHKKSIRSLTFTPDGSKVILASDDLKISLFDLNEQATISILSGHKNFITSLSAHPNSNIFGSSSYDKTVKIWDHRSSSCIDTIAPSSNANILALSFSDDGKKIVAGSENGVLSLMAA